MFESNVIVRNLTVPIDNLPGEFVGLRLAHVSDFHFRRWNRVFQAAQDLLLSLEFDLLLATGDFCEDPYQWTQTAGLIRRFFQPIAQRVPVYGIVGNHDHPAMAADPDMPIKFLINQAALIKHGGAEFELAGVDQSRFGSEDLDSALGSSRRYDLSILLAHYPSTIFRLPPGRVDLQLSGHTHGGQIRFPFVGCIWTADRIARKMARGLHRVGHTFLHINPGIGVSLPIPVRIICPPEVTLLTLEPATQAVRSAPAGDLAATISR